MSRTTRRPGDQQSKRRREQRVPRPQRVEKANELARAARGTVSAAERMRSAVDQVDHRWQEQLLTEMRGCLADLEDAYRALRAEVSGR